jgi:hypothetical protein
MKHADHHMRPAGEEYIKSGAGEGGRNDQAIEMPVAGDDPIILRHMQRMQAAVRSRMAFGQHPPHHGSGQQRGNGLQPE